MRRAPTFRRARRRARGRLIAQRTGLGVLALAVLAGIGSLVGDDSTDAERAGRVSFAGSNRAEGVPQPPGSSAVAEAATEIRDFLDDWYQRAFVDPGAFGDGTFGDVARRFVGDAGVGFVEDRDVLTIGAFAPRVARVRVTRDDANVTVYAEEGAIRYATAAVRFNARADLRDADEIVAIVQRVTLVLERRADEGWVVTNYYAASQRRRPVENAP